MDPTTSFTLPAACAPPVPRPPMIPQVRGLVVDVISEVTHHGWGWAARVSDSGSEVLRVNVRHRSDAVLDLLARDVADWLCKQSPGQGIVTVRVHSEILRAAIISRLSVEAFALHRGLALTPSASWVASAREVLYGCLEDQEVELHRHRVLYAASDGATHPHFGNSAYAWVTEHGDYRVATVTGSIVHAELQAIVDFGYRTRWDTFGKAVLFVDSLHAIHTITDRGPLLRSLPQRKLDKTLRLIGEGRLELVWVRGHEGHMLNDVADRLALMRHRAVRMRLSQDSIAAAAETIIDHERQVLLKTNWRRAAKAARAKWMAHEAVHGSDWSARRG